MYNMKSLWSSKYTLNCAGVIKAHTLLFDFYVLPQWVIMILMIFYDVVEYKDSIAKVS